VTPGDGAACVETSIVGDFTAYPTDPTLENGGMLNVAPGPVLRAKGTPPPGGGFGVQAAANWTLATGPDVQSAHLAFAFRATYSMTKVYASLGCRLQVEMRQNRASEMNLVYSSPQFRIGGRQVVGDGPETSSLSLAPTLDVPALDTLHAVTFDITLGLPTSQIMGTVDGKGPITGTLNTPLAVEAISARCGILYADGSDQGDLVVEVSSMTLSVCR